MQITVTQEDIDKGVPGSFASCPIAHALRRKFPEAIGISVRAHTFIDVVNNGKKERLPFVKDRYADEFIANFDNGRNWLCKPFEFSLQPKFPTGFNLTIG